MADYMEFFRRRAKASFGLDYLDREREMDLAFQEYCDARRVVSISVEELENLRTGNPFQCNRCDPYGWEADMLNGCDRNLESDKLEALIMSAMTHLRFIWRPMLAREQLTTSDQLKLMSPDELEQAMKLFGRTNILKAMFT